MDALFDVIQFISATKKNPNNSSSKINSVTDWKQG